MSPAADEPQPAKMGHVPALDGIRGIAVTLVLLYHFFLFRHTYAARDPSWVRPAARLFDLGSSMGWIGVQMFFILSGFLITGILDDARHSRGFFRTFYGRRALRIMPLYYTVLLLYLMLVPHLGLPARAHLHFVEQHQAWYWLFMTNFLFISGAGWDSLTSHFWTLAVEEQFYLLWPLVVWWLDRRQMMNLCQILLGAAFVLRIVLLWDGTSAQAIYLLTPTEIDGLVAGAFLALVIRSGGSRPFAIRHGRALTLVSLATLGGIVLRHHGLSFADPVVPIEAFTALAVVFGALVYAGATQSATSRVATVLGNPVIRFLGKYSYAIYLFHMPIIQLWIAPQRAEAWLVRDGIPPFFAHVADILVVTTGIVAVSLVSWHLIEQPFLRLRRGNTAR